MAVFDIFKRLVNQNAVPNERREDDRLRATLGARVLVVDDSATIRAVLGKMLMQDGYEVLRAADGENAVEMAQSQFPDLIFLDIVLPGMSGFAVLRALRRDSRTRTTPIIMMSGNQQATEQFYVQRFGADGFIKKPFGRAEVFHAVRSLVQAERLPARAEAPPAEAIPEGVSAEEWNAIPDVAMPDEAHMQAGIAATGAGIATPAAGVDADIDPPRATAVPAGSAPALGTTNLAAAATTPALQPTLAAATSPAIAVSLTLATPSKPVASGHGGGNHQP